MFVYFILCPLRAQVLTEVYILYIARRATSSGDLDWVYNNVHEMALSD